MKINSLKIKNFRGIGCLEVAGLGDTIIISGQNGSGKSCIFDAIRLLKSTYGGYQQNEWQNFFGEFAIQLHGPKQNLAGLFNNKTREISVEAAFSLRKEERRFLLDNATELLTQTIWQSLVPEAFQFGGYKQTLFSAQFRDKQPEVEARLAVELPEILREVSQQEVVGRVRINPNGTVSLNRSLLLSVIFSNYRPRDIGVIDFHGAQRHYGRETIQGVNLSLNDNNQNSSAHALYNYSNKYANVKSEMAANFVREILAEKANPEILNKSSLSETLKELFEVFFPDKKFMGAVPTKEGGLDFPVITSGGSTHDLDELSSGEKEILYGYLRIRSSAPKSSIILLDEPELHLNPRLIRRLPEFYRKHLGENLKNQLWLITHSDALIREAVGKPGFNVFHMLPLGAEDSNKSQLKELSLNKDLDAALTDLIGDLAAYRPGGKGVIFEGGGDSDFDKNMVFALFSQELKGINLISGSNKNKVRALHDVLERAWSKGDLPTKFFSITDKDLEENITHTEALRKFSWDVYHIENYLLDVDFITDSVNAVVAGKKREKKEISELLEASAREVVPMVVEHKLRSYVNGLIVNCISLGFKPGSADVPGELAEAVKRSVAKLDRVISDELGYDSISAQKDNFLEEIDFGFADGSWNKSLPGRDVLKRFSGSVNIPYEMLRNLIVSRMAERGHQPQGMKDVIEKIVLG